MFLASPTYFRKGLGSWIYKETINTGFKELGITKFFSKEVKDNEKKIKFNLLKTTKPKSPIKPKGPTKKQNF